MSALFVLVDAFVSNDEGLFRSLKLEIQKFTEEFGPANTYSVSIYNSEYFDNLMVDFRVNSAGIRSEGEMDLIYQMLDEFKDSNLIFLISKQDINSLNIQRKNNSDFYQFIKVKVYGKDIIEVVTTFDSDVKFEDNLTNIQNTYITSEIASILTTAQLNEKNLQNHIQNSAKSLENSRGILEVLRSSNSSVDTSLQNQILKIENEINQISDEAKSGIQTCEIIKQRLLVEKNFEDLERDDKNFILYPTRFNINQLSLKHEASSDWSKHLFTVKNNTNYYWYNLSIVFVKNNLNETTFGDKHYGERLSEIEVIKPHEEIQVAVGYTDETIEILGFYKVQIFYHSQPVSNTVDLSSISVVGVTSAGEKMRTVEFRNNIRAIKNCKIEAILIKANTNKTTNMKEIPTRALGKLPVHVIIGEQYLIKFSKDGLLLSEPYTFTA